MPQNILSLTQIKLCLVSALDHNLLRYSIVQLLSIFKKCSTHVNQSECFLFRRRCFLVLDVRPCNAI